MLRPALLGLACAAALAGCALTDCSFETTDVSYFGSLSTDGGSLGDTLAVVIVEGYDRRIDVFTPAGGAELAETEENINGVPTVSVVYNAEGLELGDVAPYGPQLAVTRRGDTLYVYAEGSLAPDLFTEVCSPPEAYLRVDVIGVRAPASVRVLRVTSVRVDELEARTARALRQLDADRPRAPIVA